MNTQIINNDIDSLFDQLATSIKLLHNSVDFDDLRNQLDQCNDKLQDSNLWQTPAQAKDLHKLHKVLSERLSNLTYIFDQYDYLKELRILYHKESNMNELKSFLNSLKSLCDQVKREELTLLFVGDDDLRNCFVEIHAGSGGLDAQDFASMLLRMYLRWGDKRGFSTNIVDESIAESAGIKSAVIKISGAYCYGLLKNEHGVHRLVRLSPFNSDGKRHTSFVAVKVFPEIENDDTIIINDKDIIVDTFKSSGAGGQHVNTTDSAVRITHIPTSIVVQSQGERSQHTNKAHALSLLKAKLYELELIKQQEKKQDQYHNRAIIDFGSQIRSYVLHPYRMVKDHRNNFVVNDAQVVLDGQLDEIIISLLTYS